MARRLASLARGRFVVLHCRGEAAVEWADAIAEGLDPSAIVADVRGAWPEELLFARGFDGVVEADAEAREAYGAAMAVTRAATTRADHVLSVSAGMMDWLRRLGVPDDKLEYVPCCTQGPTHDPAVRARLRDELGLRDRLVLCYSGTITRYQHVEDGVLPFFRAAAGAIPELHLLCLTPDAGRMERLVAGAGVDPARVTVLRLPQQDVAAYLSAADAGLLLRAPSALNRLSQPTKFAEYLAAGLPVIVSHGTGDVPRIVTDAAAGLAITLFGLSGAERDDEARHACTLLRANAAQWRANAVALCEREFVWSRYTESVRQIYRACMNGSNLQTTRERVLT
jgi:glycosyltransferase involved in cell wall biosynthesis